MVDYEDFEEVVVPPPLERLDPNCYHPSQPTSEFSRLSTNGNKYLPKGSAYGCSSSTSNTDYYSPSFQSGGISNEAPEYQPTPAVSPGGQEEEKSVISTASSEEDRAMEGTANSAEGSLDSNNRNKHQDRKKHKSCDKEKSSKDKHRHRSSDRSEEISHSHKDERKDEDCSSSKKTKLDSDQVESTKIDSLDGRRSKTQKSNDIDISPNRSDNRTSKDESSSKHSSSKSSSSYNKKSKEEDKENRDKKDKKRKRKTDDQAGVRAVLMCLDGESPSKQKESKSRSKDKDDISHKSKSSSSHSKSRRSSSHSSRPASDKQGSSSGSQAPVATTASPPTPALKMDVISPNYKPLARVPLPELLSLKDLDTYPSFFSSIVPDAPQPMQQQTIAQFTSTGNGRRQIYSGKVRAPCVTAVPSLFELSVKCLQKNIDSLKFTGGIPYGLLKPVLERATAKKLYSLEYDNPYLLDDTHRLWEQHCKKDFKGKKPDEMETYRDSYMRLKDERSQKLKSLTENLKSKFVTKPPPQRKTQLAFIDTVAKPPKHVARAQAKYGTGVPVGTPARTTKAAEILARKQAMQNMQRVERTTGGAASNGRPVSLAFIDTVAKPPKHVAGAQAKYGTGVPVGTPARTTKAAEILARKQAMQNMQRVERTTGGAASNGRPVSRSPTCSKKKPMAPLMAKTMQFYKKICRR